MKRFWTVLVLGLVAGHSVIALADDGGNGGNSGLDRGDLSGMGFGLLVILMTFGLIIVLRYMRTREERERQLTVRAMIEKGVPVPESLLAGTDNDGRRHRKHPLSSGISMIAIGSGLSLWFYLAHKDMWPIGLFIAIAGVGRLIGYAFTRPATSNG